MMDDGTFTNSQTTENGDENFGLMDSQQSVLRILSPCH